MELQLQTLVDEKHFDGVNIINMQKFPSLKNSFPKSYCTLHVKDRFRRGRKLKPKKMFINTVKDLFPCSGQRGLGN